MHQKGGAGAEGRQQAEVLTVKEVQERLRCHIDTVYDLFRTGALKGFRLKPGSQKGIRIWAASLEDHLDRMTRNEQQSRPPKEAAAVVRRAAKTVKRVPGERPAKSGLILRHPS
jgi:hypothetical protein